MNKQRKISADSTSIQFFFSKFTKFIVLHTPASSYLHSRYIFKYIHPSLSIEDRKSAFSSFIGGRHFVLTRDGTLDAAPLGYENGNGEHDGDWNLCILPRWEVPPCQHFVVHLPFWDRHHQQEPHALSPGWVEIRLAVQTEIQQMSVVARSPRSRQHVLSGAQPLR